MGQAKRKARKRAVRDIDDSANAEAGGERRHFDIPSSQRKVTVRSEVSFDDDKKKKNTRSNGRRERRVSSELRIGGGSGGAEMHVFTVGKSQWARRHFVWSDVETYDASSMIDRSMDRSTDRWRRRSGPSQWRRLKEFPEARLDSVAPNVRERKGVGCGVKS
jgi:hypothetical protein